MGEPQITKTAVQAPGFGKKYRYWRIRTFYSIYFGYALFYFSRKSFTFAMPMMIDELGYTKSDLGFLGSVLYITYGVSKFLSGILSDKLSPRLFMASGLAITGVCNVLFGMSSSLTWFGIFWALNGVFLGWGWPPCTKQLMHWFSSSERGRWWSLNSTSHNLGGAAIPLVAAGAGAIWGWQSAMILPGVICILGGLLLFERCRGVPSSLGLPPVEVYRGEQLTTEATDKSKMSVKDILFGDLISVIIFNTNIINIDINKTIK